MFQEANYIVVGAGLSGAIIARRIAEDLNKKVIVVENRGVVAGNCYDYKDKITNISVHKYGPHVFHTNNDTVWKYLSKFTNWEPFFYKVKCCIDGNEINIPFNLNSLYKSFNSSLAIDLENALLDKFDYGSKVYLKDLICNNNKLNFLYEFIKNKIYIGYSSKQWGVDFEKLDKSIINRVPILISKDDRYFQDKYSAIPSNGYTSLVSNILDHKNISLCLNCNKDYVNNFILNDDNKYVFYTAAIDELFNYRFGQLNYRSLDIRFTTYDREFYQSCAQINYPLDYDFTRSVEYKYYLNEYSQKTIVSREYPLDFELDKFDSNGNRLERFYPIHNKETQHIYSQYIDYANEYYPNIKFIGRLATYKYINMDECVHNALTLKLI